ncbi:MAG: bifunctional 2-methylcitrate dehydratase/aconitate hydratase [Chloroflexota bacterium]|nr:bifunctional 2-methylcitrate dehydratase/aconitate hydratase [Chloroflexota bacterium]
MTLADPNPRPDPDELLQTIARYAVDTTPHSPLAYQTARLALMDALGCAVLALDVEECARLVGPVVPGTRVPIGVHVPGTAFVLDPVKAAFDIGSLVRWLDYNDTWLAAEWGHPSDNFGAILAAAEYATRLGPRRAGSPLLMADVLDAAIRAYEIQGVLALENSFNRLGIDHVLLVRVASTAVATCLLGGGCEQVLDAVSNAWLDGANPRAYRQAPNAGSRKSWAAGDATSRAVRLAMMTLQGQMGYPTALSAPRWGFSDALFAGRPIVLAQPFGSYVMENILFKVSYPAEFHAQTAAEAAISLHPIVRTRLREIQRIEIETQEPALRIISKVGPLHNAADRDHCLQYIVAVALLRGRLLAADYEDAAAAEPAIDWLRERMVVVEQPRYSRDYLDPARRSIANAIQVVFADGTRTERVEVEYPLGHRRRRAEAIPLLEHKLERNLLTRLPPPRVRRILELARDHDRLAGMPVPAFMELLSTAPSAA